MAPFEIERRVQPGQVHDRPERSAIDAQLADLEGAMLLLEEVHRAEIGAVHPDHRQDAVNLVHYLALRQADIRLLQRRLGALGLSSLGRCEAHVLATVRSVRAALDGSAFTCVSPGLSFE